MNMDANEKYDLKRELERYVAGELDEAEIARLQRCFMDDPLLRSALEEYGLSRYADGELSTAELNELAEHINSNPELRGALEEYQLSRYLDGELTQAEVAELRDRIETNPALKDALKEYESLEKEIAALGEEQPAVDFQAQLRNIISEVKKRGDRQPD